MNAVLLILLAASVGHGLARALKLPHAPLLILAGGALDLFGAPIEAQTARDALLLGLAFLVFLSGTSLNPWRLGSKGQFGLILGVVQFFLLSAASFGVCFLLEFTPKESLYIAVAMSSSSTLVVIKLLRSRGELFDPFGRLMTGALLAQDFLMLLIVAGLTNIHAGAAAALIASFAAAALFVFGAAFKKWVVPWLMLREGVDEEMQLILALGVLFVFAGLAYALKLPFVTGAFVAGVSLSSFPVNGTLRGQFASLNHFFSAVFFVTLGLFVDFPPAASLDKVLWLALLIVFLSPLLSSIVAWSRGATLRTGVEAGLLLAQAGEFSIVLTLIGFANGDLTGQHLSLVVSVTVLTMMFTPFMANETTASWGVSLIASLFKNRKSGAGYADHYVLIGCGDSGMALLEKLLAAEAPVAVIDDDAGVVRAVREMGAYGVLGNGKDPDILALAGVDKAKLVISSMRKFSDNKGFLKAANPSALKVVRVFDREEASLFKQAGALPIPSTEAASSDLVEWVQKIAPTQATSR